MKKRIISSITAMALTLSAIPCVIAHADDEIINFKQQTFDEAITSVSGEYVTLTEYEKLLYPHIGHYDMRILTIENTGQTHNIEIVSVVTSIKVKAGFELPYDEIKSAVSENGMIMPVFRQHGNDFELINANDLETYNFTLDYIKNLDVVLSIENQYSFYEDTVNHVYINSLIYTGDMTEEELLKKYPELSEWTFNNSEYGLSMFLSEEAESVSDNPIYDIAKILRENNEEFSCSWMMTELAGPIDMIYCNSPVLIDGTDGDANTDGNVNISDAVMVMQSVANPNKYGVKAKDGISAQGCQNADVDNNGVTNADALEIQKSILGIGSIPIPDNNYVTDLVDYDDFIVNKEFYKLYTDETDKSPEKSYFYCGSTANRNKVGEKIAENYLYNSEQNKSDEIAEIFVLNNISTEHAVAVKTKTSNNYHVFVKDKYIPETFGELIDSLNLTEELIFASVYYTNRDEKISNLNVKADSSKIWETLLSERNAVRIERFENDEYIIANQRAPRKEISISCDMPIYGRYNFGLHIRENGWVTTNAVMYGFTFHIPEEKAVALIDSFAPEN